MAATALQRRKIELLLEKVDRLPTLPGVACRALPLAMADQISPRRLQQMIESDAALAARALALAAPRHPTPEGLTSIEAVMRALPPETVAADLLTLTIVDAETRRLGRLTGLWRHNLAVAMAAQVIAKRLQTIPPEDAHLAGLLHDIGLIALPLLMPRAYAQVLERIESDGGDVLEAERDLLGIEHPVVGKRLAERWGYPEPIRKVIWLHHQGALAGSNGDAAGLLTRVVHLADLISRSEGFACHPSERLREDPGEAAARLGLSPETAAQIGRQVASALRLNSEPVGLEDEPTPGQLWPLVAGANARLGALYERASERRTQLEIDARRSDLLVTLNARLAAARSSRETLETAAETAREALGLRIVVPYLLAPDYAYIEGLLVTADLGVEETFLYEVSNSETLETLLADGQMPFAAHAAPMRAERVESWLFERLGGRLGDGPFYTVPMLVEGTKVGGFVFAFEGPERELTRRETNELSAVASMAGVALRRAQAEAAQVALSEQLAGVNRALQLAQDEQLERRNVASVSEMAAGAAHEINNPLAIISGRAQQLAADETGPERKAKLQTIIDQAARASDIIAELRRFARPAVPRPERVDPTRLAKDVVGRFEEAASKARVELTLQAPRRVPEVRVDPARVAEALDEIVRNAVEACQEGGHVTLLVQEAEAEAVRILVVDDGAGMEPADRARALDPFFSGREAGRRLGLGLPKAYRTIQANQGHMVLESKPGAGTTVRITFPAAGPARDAETAETAPETP